MTRRPSIVAVDAVEDPPDGDPLEVLEHVQLAVHRVEAGRVLDAEVVGEKGEGLHAPLPLLVGIAEEVHELLGPSELGPGLPEQVIQELGRTIDGGVVEESLQGEMSRRAAGLIHRCRLAETVDGTELVRAGGTP